MKSGTIIKTFISKKGNAVVFRSLRRKDLDGMLAYANALIREDTYIELSGKTLTREEEQKSLTDALLQIKEGKKIWIVVEINGVYSGSGEVRIGSRRHSHVGEIGISIAQQYRAEGIGTELLKTLVEQARVKKLRLLTLSCFEGNTAACYLYEKLGFQKGGVIPESILYKERYIGELKYYLPLSISDTIDT